MLKSSRVVISTSLNEGTESKVNIRVNNRCLDVRKFMLLGFNTGSWLNVLKYIDTRIRVRGK